MQRRGRSFKEIKTLANFGGRGVCVVAMTPTSAFSISVDGVSYAVPHPDPQLTLLDFLRQRGLTAPKEGCGEGDCGACTVVAVDTATDGSLAYRAINSCLVLLPMAIGRAFLTAAGMGREELHPVQQALVENDGSQCGYCTPGIVSSMFEAYYRPCVRQKWEISDHLAGNLCRCTGYRPIRDAMVEALARRDAPPSNAPSDPFAAALRSPIEGDETDDDRAPASLPPPNDGANPHSPVPQGLSRAIGNADALLQSFETDGLTFVQPTSLEALLDAVARIPNAELVGGATEIAVNIAKKNARYPALISTAAVAELRRIKTTEEQWHIGGAATLTAVEEAMGGIVPAMDKMMRVFASRQIRNRATLAGNLVTASPIGDMAPVLLALDAKVELLSAQHGSRLIDLADFFIGYRKTQLQQGEILYQIIVPKPALPPGWQRLCDSFKVSKRRELDISIVAACFRLDVDEDAIIRTARMAYGGVAPAPARAYEIEDQLVGQQYRGDLIDSVRAPLSEHFTPISDVRGSAAYRKSLVVDLFCKFLAGEKSAGQDTPLNFVQSETARPQQADASRALHHDSAVAHANGAARYVHDEAMRRAMFEVWPVCSPHAHARIISLDTRAALEAPGVVCILTADDVPGQLRTGPVKADEELLARDEVHYHGHPIALVVAHDRQQARRAAAMVTVEYEILPAVVTIHEGISAGSFSCDAQVIRRGDAEAALDCAPHRLQGTLQIGSQEHFYLETQAAWAEPDDRGDAITVSSSTQHPTEIQECVAEVLGLHAHQVVSQSPRLGGAFGGKESQARIVAAMAALAAWRTGTPCRLQLDRDIDMLMTGKRHPFLAQYEVGFDSDGKLLAVSVDLYSNGGYSLDLSRAILDRALFHIDNAYYVPALRVGGRVVRTNTASNTAFRGFGGPQAMVVIEEIMDRVARASNLDPTHVRGANLYRGSGESCTTHYGQELGDHRLQQIWQELCDTAQVSERRRAVDAFNERSAQVKRGVAVTPVKFGISFTTAFLNQAGALLNVYRDGTAQVSIAGTEMGQGLYAKVQGVAARELGLSPARVRVMITSTEKVPNTSPTAASSGSDLNGAAVLRACESVRSRLIPVAAELLAQRVGKPVAEASIGFAEDRVFCVDAPTEEIPFADVALQAHRDCVSLSAIGYYRTPDIHFDPDTGRGKPFHYFACGAAMTEVEVDGYTGMKRVLRTDIVHDVGQSLNPTIDRGQIEGAFVQGMGWLTGEELLWDYAGKLLTHSASTYQIPAFSDTPVEFNVRLLQGAPTANTIHGSKAVGEPPFMLAISVREAIRDAVAAFAPGSHAIDLPVPATHEGIHTAIRKLRSAPASGALTEHEKA